VARAVATRPTASFTGPRRRHAGGHSASRAPAGRAAPSMRRRRTGSRLAARPGPAPRAVHCGEDEFPPQESGCHQGQQPAAYGSARQYQGCAAQGRRAGEPSVLSVL
jgi:hypothetical protein